MRYIATLLAAAALVWVAVSTLVSAQDAGETGCEGSTVDMMECLADKAEQWDKRLNAAYQKALKAAASPKQREQLRVAQRLWVQYRDANCLYWALGEGTIARLQSVDCSYRMTRSRAEELSDDDK